MFGELEKALEEQLSAWDLLKSKEIPELNGELKKAGQRNRSAKASSRRGSIAPDNHAG